MKITFVLPTVDLSGGIRVVAIYAERLARAGHDVALYSVPPPAPKIKNIIKDLIRLKRPSIRRTPQDSHLDFIDVRHTIINKNRPIIDSDLPDADVVIATWWETAEWVARLSNSKGAKVFFIQHHEVFDYLPIHRVRNTWSLPLQKITISKWLIDLASNEYGDQNAILIPNSVDTNQFNAPLRTKNSIPAVGILYGRQPWKGIQISIEAVEAARKIFPDLRLIAFGAEYPNPENPLPEYCEFHYRPAQNSIKDIYSQCDVWLCGSFSEGFHLPPSEAMACRCPVVSTAVGGPVDIIKNGFNGFISPCGDSEALADNLIKVLNLPPNDWLSMSNNAYQTVTTYTWDDATKLFEDGLKMAIQRGF